METVLVDQNEKKKKNKLSSWSKSFVKAVEDTIIPIKSEKSQSHFQGHQRHASSPSLLSSIWPSKKDKKIPIFRRTIDDHGKEVTYVGRFQILNEILGSGGNSVVHKGIDTQSGVTVAIKCIKTSHPKPKSAPSIGSNLTNETLVVRNLLHPNIYQFIEAYRTDEYIYAVFEYVEGGGLFDLVSQKGRLDENEARSYFHQMVNTLDYLHTNNVLHNDIKLENTLINSQKEIKLIDFGHASSMIYGLSKPVRYSTLSYTAPEILMYEEASPKSDVWSLGVTLYVMTVGSFPFDKTDEEKTRTSIVVSNYDKSKMKDLSPELCDLISKMLTSEPSQRISLGDIKHHSWFQVGLGYYPSFGM